MDLFRRTGTRYNINLDFSDGAGGSNMYSTYVQYILGQGTMY